MRVTGMLNIHPTIETSIVKNSAVINTSIPKNQSNIDVGRRPIFGPYTEACEPNVARFLTSILKSPTSTPISSKMFSSPNANTYIPPHPCTLHTPQSKIYELVQRCKHGGWAQSRILTDSENYSYIPLISHVQDYSLKISILSATRGGHCHNEEFSANTTGEALT